MTPILSALQQFSCLTHLVLREAERFWKDPNHKTAWEKIHLPGLLYLEIHFDEEFRLDDLFPQEDEAYPASVRKTVRETIPVIADW